MRPPRPCGGGTVSPAAGPCRGFSGSLETYGNDGRLTILLLGSDYRTQALHRRADGHYLQ